MEVLLAVAGRGVDQPGPVDLDVLGGVDLEGALAGRVLDPIAERVLVVPAHHVRAVESFDHFVVVVPAGREHLL